jgi:hypothetical protein
MSSMETPNDTVYPYRWNEEQTTGITIRELFAAHALAGFACNPERYSPEEAAKLARVAADELCSQLIHTKGARERYEESEAERIARETSEEEAAIRALEQFEAG